MADSVLTIALTGGIASGKTAVSDHFSRLGVPIIDTDRISRELVQPGMPALKRIARRFGQDFITSDGHLDRKKLREHIFNDGQAKTDLENILHPAIRDEVTRRIARLEDAPYVVLVIPLLSENPSQYAVDRILLVDALESLQIQRVCQRDQITEAQAKKILASQASRKERQDIADEIIDNTGSLEALKQQVERLHQRYLALSKHSH